MSHKTDLSKHHARIFARAWMDPGYLKQLVADPKAVFRIEGIEVPDDITLRVVVDTPSNINIVLSERASRAVRPRSKTDDDIYAYLATAFKKAQEHASYRKRLLADPIAALTELGAHVPRDMTFTVHIEAEGEQYFIVPLTPKAGVTLKRKSGKGAIEAVSGAGLDPKPTTKPMNMNVNINIDVNVDSQINTNGVVNVNAIAAVTATVFAFAFALIKAP